MSENYYEILGIKENATRDEIKKAYRSLQMKFHPDKNPGSQEAMNMTQKINGAYEVLGDDQKREEYDMMKRNPFFKMGNNMNNMSGAGMEVPMDDIFNMFFGGMPTGVPGFGFPPGGRIHVFNGGPMPFHQAINKPVPIMKTLQVNMEQVYSGATIPMEIERWILENGTKIFEKETIYVDVYPGIDDNELIILRDKGNIINEQTKGDIKIMISVENNTPFRREGLDLLLEKTISLKDALCGFKFDIKYINGKSYTLNNNKGNIVPAEYRKVYPEMGLKRGEHKGNMIILFHVEFPERLTEEQIEKLSAIL